MKLAVNYSPAAAELVRSGRLEVDLFKCPEWPDLVSAARAVRPPYVHFGFRAGTGLDQADWGLVERMLAETGTPHVNAHLAPCAADLDGLELTSIDPQDRRWVTERMAADLRVLAERFGPERVFGENLMWAPQSRWQIPQLALEGGVIRTVLAETGCGLLLDLAHATVAARWLGVDEREYIEELPVDTIGELHVSGVQRERDGLWMDHHPMSAFDWELLDWAVERLASGAWRRPAILSFEYGGAGPIFADRTDPAVLAEQLPRIRSALARAL
jgi:uncharacterized protein (UPF0276 family)